MWPERRSAYKAFKGGILGVLLLVAACAAPAATTRLPGLPEAVASRDLVPQEFLCPLSGVKATPNLLLAQEIRVFLEENGMLGGIPAKLASDLPITLNGQVQAYLRSFARSDNFKAGLARSERYMAMIRRIFEEYGLPKDLIYLALIESGFSPGAKSPAGAVGIWQFVAGTARRYGLQVNDRVDERCDPEKSTRAAARYLKDLYSQFGCWYLAAAGYNAGEHRVEGVIAKHDTRDFWSMAEKKWLPRETCNYVPQLIAAVLITKNPEQYGLHRISSQNLRKVEQVKVPGGTDLSWFAASLQISGEDLKELNPELKIGAVPADRKEYSINIPAAKKREAQRIAGLCWKMAKVNGLVKRQ